MALGEWLSVQSSRELHQHQIGLERAEIKASPEEEVEEHRLVDGTIKLVPLEALPSSRAGREP